MGTSFSPKQSVKPDEAPLVGFEVAVELAVAEGFDIVVLPPVPHVPALDWQPVLQ